MFTRFIRVHKALPFVAAVVVSLVCGAEPGTAQEPAREEERNWYQQRWGLGFTLRTASIPFATEEKTVATLIPLIMYEGDRVYFRETEAGVRLLRGDRVQVSAMGRLHFFDIPTQYQNEIQGDRVDWGAQLRFVRSSGAWLDAELLSDRDGNVSVIGRGQVRKTGRRFRFDAFGQAAYHTGKYNTLFWGLRQSEVGAGVDLTAGANVYAHLLSSLYLQGAFVATYLASAVRDAPLVEDDVQWRGFLGFGISNDRRQDPGRALTTSPYWRFAHHWGTPSSLAQILRFNAEPDPFESRLTSVFYGLPLTDRLFTLPVHVFLHSGVGLHWPSDFQGTELELVLSIKLMYTIPLPVRLRIGMAEGVSVVSSVPALETSNLEEKGYKPSDYVNYLDPSLDLNLGDLLPWSMFDDVWLGYVIHHRSSIFETAQQFGRIKGGSNYQGIYVQVSM